MRNVLLTPAKIKAVTKVILGIIALTLCYSNSVVAQSITNYAFSASSVTYTTLSSPTSPSLSSGNADDGYFNTLPIGFDFFYMGARYTTISASTNGWLTLGANITNSQTTNNLNSGGSPRPILAPLWDDLDIQNASNFTYETTGSVGSRVFTAQYTNVQWQWNASNAGLSFQILLHESTGEIVFKYSRIGNSTANLNNPSASIGITATGTGSGNFLSLNGSGGSPTASSTSETTNISSKPSTNRNYAFTPPTPNAPSALTFSGVTTSAMQLNWTDNSSNERAFAIYQSTDGVNYTYYSQVGANTTSSLISGLTTSTLYYWKVYAVSEGALSGALSGNQSTMSLTVNITPSGPTSFCSPNSVILSVLTPSQATGQVPPSGGSTPTDCNCPDGYAVVGIEGRTGWWVDQFTLRCRKINGSGNLVGPIVLTSTNGNSGGGSAVGPYDLPANNVMVGGTVTYYNNGGTDYLLSIALRGQAISYVSAGNVNSSGSSAATILSGTQPLAGTLGTIYAPDGNVITGMKAFNNGYSGGVQWIYTPLTQLTTTYSWAPGGETTPSITVTTSGTYTVTASGGYTGTDSEIITAGVSGEWAGTTSSAWGTTSNWGCGILPLSTTDVTIPASAPNMPIMTGTATIRNLTIAPSASLTNNGTANIYGDLTNTGNYIDNGTTAFLGSIPQIITGVDTLHSVIINNAAGVSLATPTYVEGHLTLTNGVLTSNNKLTVDLNVGAITGAGTGSIAGNMTVLKWVWNDGWHYISSPLSGKTFTSWNDDVLIKYGANSNLYSYDETVVDTSMEVGWTPVTNAATAIQDMRGYALYFKRWSYKTTIDLTGTYNHAQTYSSGSLTNTVSAKPAADGWHLMGNPYPCVIDWDAASGWTKTGLDGAVYVWDGRNSRFATYVGGIGTNGGSRYIPAMQGFYVKVSTPGGTGTLAMNNNVRTTASNPDVWRVASEEKRIHLTATNGTDNDETYIRFTDEASTSFDTGYDAYKLANTGNTPSISTKVGKEQYAINSLPNTLENAIIPVPLNVGLTGAYAINADVSNFDLYESVILEDRLLNTFQDLKTEPSYSAALTQGDTSTRFFLHYKKEAKTTGTNNSTSIQHGLNIYAYKQNITINFNDANVSTANVMVFDAIGNQVHRIENANTTSGKIEFGIQNANTGIYIVKVQSTIGVTNQQVYISR